MNAEMESWFFRAKRDRQFTNDLLSSNSDSPPANDSDEIDKHLFVAAYYGWRIAKYGDKWESPRYG